jgi:signal recognition particle receptor subunit beta
VAQVNPLTREVLLKLVFYGPGLGGKTTSLQAIHAAAPPETRGEIVSLATPVDRTLYFDFMPLRVPPVRGHPVRVQLFTVPGQVYFNATRKLLLTGADGVMFVADSQRERMDANVESLENLDANLIAQGRELASVPHAFQYNKRDLPNALPVAELERLLNRHAAPAVETSAITGRGVLQALDVLVRIVLDALEAQRTFGESVASSVDAAPRFGRAGDALDEQVGRASEQLWRETVDRAVANARTQGEAGAVTLVRTATRAAAVPASAGVLDAVPADAAGVPADAAPVPAAPSAVALPVAPPPPKVPAAAAVRVAPSAAERRPPSTAAPPPPRAVAPASAPLASAPAAVSFALLFDAEIDLVTRVERAIADARFDDAVLAADVVALRVLASVAAASGLGDVSSDPAFVAHLLGVDGARWLAFRRLVRRTRAGLPATHRDALEAYAAVVDLGIRRDLALA